MRSIPIHNLAEAKLCVNPHKNSAKLYPKTDVPTGIEPIVIQAVITECIDFLISIDIDTSNRCLAIELGFTTYPTGKIRPCRNDQVSIVCNIEIRLEYPFAASEKVVWYYAGVY